MKSSSSTVKEQKLIFSPHSEAGTNVQPIELVVRKSARRRVGFKISVLPDQTVRIDAPLQANQAEIGKVVVGRLDWIRTQQRRLADKPAIPKLLYQNGEQHLFLGLLYPLQITETNSRRTFAALKNGQLEICLGKPRQNSDQNPDQDQTVKKALQAWYSLQATAFISDYLIKQVGRIDWLDQVPAFRLRLMRGRWGSCSRKGGLLFNRHLIKAPQQCIAYVIAHELCHLREFNHSPAFYRLLAELDPDWRSGRTLLDEQAALIMNA